MPMEGRTMESSDFSSRNGTGAAPTVYEPSACPLPDLPDCDPSRFVDWRLRRAGIIITLAAPYPLEQEDPWVAETVELLRLCRDGWEDRQPTDRQLAIREANDLGQRRDLVKDVLEARMLAQEDPHEIADKMCFAPATIEAYGKLLFDVVGHQRRQVWGASQFFAFPAQLTTTPARRLGEFLKTIAILHGPETLEDFLEVLLRFRGRTLVDNLPDRDSPGWPKEIRTRFSIAGQLLPRSRAALVERAVHLLEDAVRSDSPSVSCGSETPKDVPHDDVPSEQIVAEQASALKESAGAGYLYGTIAGAIGDSCNPSAFLVYRNELMQQCGDPTDPLETMMIEQISLSYHAIGALRLRSSLASSAESAIAYSDAGTRLLAEFRRCILALEDYRVRGTVRRRAREEHGEDAKAASGAKNGQGSPDTAGKAPNGAKLPSKANVGGMPEWLAKRMQYPTRAESPPVAGTAVFRTCAPER